MRNLSFSILFILAILFTGCNNSGKPDEIVTNETGVTYTKTIGADGGMLDCGNGTKLEIPPGSLSKDETIKIIERKADSNQEKTGTTLIQLEPDGLTFSKPAKITVSYPETSRPNGTKFGGYSCQNGKWEEVKLIDNDVEGRKLTFEVNHFSAFVVGALDLYLVVDIPGKYLRGGDLLFTLAQLNVQVDFHVFPGFYWFPGHVGMYIGKSYKEFNNDDLLIESAPKQVRWNTLKEFISDPDHLYMGPRRYKGNLTPEQLTQITEFAMKQKEKKYSWVGQGNLKESSNSSFSCVGLTEAAYDQATPSASIIPPDMEYPYSLPIDQYKLTKPVDEISVKVGETVSIKVYGVSWSDKDKYTKTAEGISVENSPDRSRFYKDGNSYVFEWTPKEKDVNTNIDVKFLLNGESSGHKDIVTQNLLIKVVAPPIDFMNYTYPYEWLKLTKEHESYRFVNGACAGINSKISDNTVSGLVQFAKTNYTGKENEYTLYFSTTVGVDAISPTIIIVAINNGKLELIATHQEGWSMIINDSVEIAADRIVIKRTNEPPNARNWVLEEITLKYRGGKLRQTARKVIPVD